MCGAWTKDEKASFMRVPQELTAMQEAKFHLFNTVPGSAEDSSDFINEILSTRL